MGRIPKYQRDKFASQYVGGSQVDPSGAEVVAGLSDAVETVVGIEAKKIQEQNKLIIDSQANNALLKYSLAFQQEANTLQDTYANDPKKYAAAVADMGTKLQSEYLKSIPDERVAARFGGAANTLIAQSQKSAITWAANKEQENAKLAARDTARVATLQVGRTTDPAGLHLNMLAARESITNVPGLTAKDAAALEDKYMPSMIDSSVNTRLRNGEAQAVIDDLAAGAYDKLPFFSGDQKIKLERTARARLKADDKIIRDARTDNNALLQTKLYSDELEFGEIDAYETAENEAEGISTEQANRLRISLAERVKGDSVDIAKKYKKSKKYISAVLDAFSNEIDQGRALEVVNDAFDDGSFPPEEAKQLTQYLRELTNNDQILMTPAEKVKAVVPGMVTYLGQLHGGKQVGTTAREVSRFFEKLRNGEDPAKAANTIKQEATVAKVIADDPTLVNSKDPVADRYRNEATRILEKNGRSTDEAYVRKVIDRLKSRG